MKSVLLVFMFFSLSFDALCIDITGKKFDALDLVFSGYDKGAFTFPVVLLYMPDGTLKKSILGKNIYRIDSYMSVESTKKQSRVESPNFQKILTLLDLAKNDKPYELLFLTIETCPPCFVIKEKFDKNIKNKISDDFNINYINLLVN